MRTSTERPVTVDVGTNQVLGYDTARLEQVVMSVLEGHGKTGRIPEWDGKAAWKIAEALG